MVFIVLHICAPTATLTDSPSEMYFSLHCSFLLLQNRKLLKRVTAVANYTHIKLKMYQYNQH